MGLSDGIAVVYYMKCSVCEDKSKQWLTPEEALKDIRAVGWINKTYYKDTLLCEDWYCPKCTEKATEVRDTLPPEPPKE
ncbi:MAG TPA: hypothetical protein VM577_09440 [Anaerovoracaceae bacterium]|nr:hypothetical protein [Anaerovoracaceae bacterium]